MPKILQILLKMWCVISFMWLFNFQCN